MELQGNVTDNSGAVTVQPAAFDENEENEDDEEKGEFC